MSTLDRSAFTTTPISSRRGNRSDLVFTLWPTTPRISATICRAIGRPERVSLRIDPDGRRAIVEPDPEGVRLAGSGHFGGTTYARALIHAGCPTHTPLPAEIIDGCALVSWADHQETT